MNRRQFCQLAGSSLLAFPMLNSCTEKSFKEKPNFVLLVADDMGWSDMSLHGNTVIETPNLDQFARESVRFNRFYVNPVCAPTRASLLTGRHFLRTGVSHVHGGKDFMALDEITIADALKQAGYVTGMWGKWHSGKTDGYFPWQRGFDEAYMAELYKHRDSRGRLNGEAVQHSGWTTETLTNYAVNFIERHRQEPFFAYVPFLSCHGPLAASDDRIDKYVQKGTSRSLAAVYAMVERIDEQLERLLDKLNELGLAEKTVVIFLSDNGPAILNNDLSDEDRDMRYVNDLRGHKGNIWENGVRSPFFMRWPQHFKPAVVERLVDCCDLYPTLLDLAGAENPHDKPMDGRSMTEYLFERTGELPPKLSFNYANPAWPPTDKPWDPRGIKEEYRPVTPEEKKKLTYDEQIISVQDETFKLLLNPGEIDDMPDCANQGFCLYNIDNDPTQQHNVADKHPARVEKLRQDLETWWQSVLEEDSSFKMPVFLIGRDGKKENTVLAYAPYDISSNVKCAFNYTYNWRQTGDFAVYHIRVETAGKYSVVLHYQASHPEGAKVKISVNNSETKAHITDPETIQAGVLNLSKSDSFLNLEIVKSPDSKIAVFDKLFRIELKRI